MVWSDFLLAPHFEVRGLLEDDACSCLSVNGVAVIRGQPLFETRHLLEKIR